RPRGAQVSDPSMWRLGVRADGRRWASRRCMRDSHRAGLIPADRRLALRSIENRLAFRYHLGALEVRKVRRQFAGRLFQLIQQTITVAREQPVAKIQVGLCVVGRVNGLQRKLEMPEVERDEGELQQHQVKLV